MLFAIALLTIMGSAQAQLFSYEVSLESVTGAPFARTGDRYEIKGVIKNNGIQVLQTLQINWQVADGDIHTYQATDLNMSKSIRGNFTHPAKVDIIDGNDYLVKVWIASPNGQQDEKTRNDTLYHTIQVIDVFPEKHFLVEEVTGAWCGYCPRAPIIFEKQVKPNHPNAILVCLHNGDGMTSPEVDVVNGTYVSGVPCGFVNRAKVGNFTIDMSPEQWKTALDRLDPDFTPAAINVYNYYDPQTYEWKIDVVADFIMDFSGDLRLNCYVVEDSLIGTGSDWEQRNFFNANANEPYMELKGAGDPIPNYYHNHVVRKMLGGSWGQSGIIPKNVKNGERYVFSTTIKPNVRWKMEQISLVGVLQAYSPDKTQRPILNVCKTGVSLATGLELNKVENSISVFPNPVTDHVTVAFKNPPKQAVKIQIYNSLGQITQEISTSESATSGIIINTSDWQPGIYFVKAIVGDKVETRRVVK